MKRSTPPVEGEIKTAGDEVPAEPGHESNNGTT